MDSGHLDGTTITSPGLISAIPEVEDNDQVFVRIWALSSPLLSSKFSQYRKSRRHCPLGFSQRCQAGR